MLFSFLPTQASMKEVHAAETVSSPLSIISLGDVGGDGGVTHSLTVTPGRAVNRICTYVLLAYWEKREGVVFSRPNMYAMYPQTADEAWEIRSGDEISEWEGRSDLARR